MFGGDIGYKPLNLIKKDLGLCLAAGCAWATMGYIGLTLRLEKSRTLPRATPSVHPHTRFRAKVVIKLVE